MRNKYLSLDAFESDVARDGFLLRESLLSLTYDNKAQRKLLDRLKLSIGALPDSSREVLTLYLQNKTLSEISVILGVSKQAISKRFKTACSRIRLLMEQPNE